MTWILSLGVLDTLVIPTSVV